jgi:hypothetical protein
LFHPSYKYTLHIPTYNTVLILLILKAKAVPLQAWRGPEGSRRLRLPDLKIIAT